MISDLNKLIFLSIFFQVPLYFWYISQKWEMWQINSLELKGAGDSARKELFFQITFIDYRSKSLNRLCWGRKSQKLFLSSRRPVPTCLPSPRTHSVSRVLFATFLFLVVHKLSSNSESVASWELGAGQWISESLRSRTVSKNCVNSLDKCL